MVQKVTHRVDCFEAGVADQSSCGCFAIIIMDTGTLPPAVHLSYVYSGVRTKQTVLVHKGFANLGIRFETFVQNKHTFFDFVFFKWSHDFLSVIFGVLDKFWILIYFLEKAYIFFEI